MLDFDLSEAMIAVPVGILPANRPLWIVWSKVFAGLRRGDASLMTFVMQKYPRARGGAGLDICFTPIGR